MPFSRKTPRPTATTIAAATDPAIQTLRFDRRMAAVPPDEAACGRPSGETPAGFFGVPPLGQIWIAYVPTSGSRSIVTPFTFHTLRHGADESQRVDGALLRFGILPGRSLVGAQCRLDVAARAHPSASCMASHRREAVRGLARRLEAAWTSIASQNNEQRLIDERTCRRCPLVVNAGIRCCRSLGPYGISGSDPCESLAVNRNLCYWLGPLLAASASCILFPISALTASRLKLAPRCIGG